MVAVNHDQWLKKYQALNESFKSKYVFRFGADSGFFSEYNNMVLGVLFALKYKMEFVLSSYNALFADGNGWQDFFQPFCKEDNSPYNKLFNQRSYRLAKPKRDMFPSYRKYAKERLYRMGLVYGAKWIKRKYGIHYFTQDLWEKQRSAEFINGSFTIPELGLENADVLSATATVISHIWRYSPRAQKLIDEVKKEVSITGRYISMQVRAGDKIGEVELQALDEYMEKAIRYEPRQVFVLTDDYSIIRTLRSKYSDWTVHTLCTEDEAGYDHRSSSLSSQEDRYLKHIRLLASIDLCCEAEGFIGTYSANPGMFMAMRKGEAFCNCLDSDRWKLY